MKLNRRKTAQAAERKVPDFDQRLLTIVERQEDPAQRPFLELLAADTLELANQAEPQRLVGRSVLAGFLSTAAVALGALLWLILERPAFWATALACYGPVRLAARPLPSMTSSSPRATRPSAAAPASP